MSVSQSFLRRSTGTLLIGLSAAWAMAQVDLPPMQTSGSNRRTLERPPSYEPANRPSSTVYSRSSSRGTSKIPDPGIFDGSDYPEEERPEVSQIAQFENPGGQQPPPPPTKNEQGPGQQQGGGGAGPGGDGGQQGGGGPQLAGGPQIAGLPPIMGGGGGEGEQGQSGSPPPIPEGDQGDAGQPGSEGEGEGGGGEGEEGQEGQGGPQGGPEAPEGAEGRQLQKPGEIQIGDEGAKLAEADSPTVDASRQLENQQGEDRMSVKAASGAQSGNKGKGSERGVDIPSNL